MNDRGRGRVLAIGGAFYAALALGGLAWMHLRGDRLAERLLSPYAPAALAIAAGLACGGAFVVLAEMLLRRAAWAERLRAELLEMLDPLTTGVALGVALVSGVAEEILFRGALQPAIGLIATALVFGFLHGGLGRAWRGWAAFACIAGFALGGLERWSGGLLAPMVAHVTINGVELLILARRQTRPR